jgi:hypothetical protein
MLKGRQFDVDRLADEAGGVDVFEQRRVVRAEAREAGAHGMRPDRRAVDAAAQIGQIVLVGGGQGRGAVGNEFAVAIAQGDEGVGVGGSAREQLALALGQVDRQGVGGVGVGVARQ